MILGVIDWGVGGLGLVRELDACAPGLPIIYASDAGAVPYGKQAPAALAARLHAVVSALVAHGCTEVALACNAASTVVGRLRDAPVPVHGILDHGVALARARRGLIGVVGGRRTIASGVFQRALRGAGRVVRGRVAQPLSAYIEAGQQATLAFHIELARIVAPLRAADAVILACTHYPAARDAFAVALPGVALLDPAARFAVALARRAGPAARRGRARRAYFTSGDAAQMRRAARLAWGMTLPRIAPLALDRG